MDGVFVMGLCVWSKLKTCWLANEVQLFLHLQVYSCNEAAINSYACEKNSGKYVCVCTIIFNKPASIALFASDRYMSTLLSCVFVTAFQYTLYLRDSGDTYCMQTCKDIHKIGMQPAHVYMPFLTKSRFSQNDNLETTRKFCWNLEN